MSLKISNILFILFEITKCLQIPKELTRDLEKVHQDGRCYKDSSLPYSQIDCTSYVEVGRLVSGG